MQHKHGRNLHPDIGCLQVPLLDAESFAWPQVTTETQRHQHCQVGTTPLHEEVDDCSPYLHTPGHARRRRTNCQCLFHPFNALNACGSEFWATSGISNSAADDISTSPQCGL
eukprot:4587093-Amphidinium_carterae.1